MPEKTRLDILLIDREDVTKIYNCADGIDLTFDSIKDAIKFIKQIRKELSNKYHRIKFVLEEIE